jgi:hypothetical protein
MDPKQIAQMLASGDPEQVKAAQVQLQALGYDVKPDGKLGPATSAAVAAYRTDSANNQTTELGIAEANREANDPTNKAINMGIETAPYVAGMAGGTALGHYAFGKPFKESDTTMRGDISRIASDKGISPAIKEKEMNRLVRGRNMRNVAQFGAPGLLFGAGALTRDLIAPQFSDPAMQDVIKLVATGENAAGGALALHQGFNTLQGMGKGADPVDVARIRSGNAPPPPPPAAPPPPPGGNQQGHQPMRYSDRLKMAVTAAGARPGKTKAANVEALKRSLTTANMPAVADALNLPGTADRSTVLQRLREISKIGGKLVFPIGAGVAAYEMAGSPAEAADGTTPEPSTGQRLGAAGAAAGATYGAGKLMQAVPAIGKAMGPLGAALSAHDYASQAQDMRGAMPEGIAGDIGAQVAPLAMRGASDIEAMRNLPAQAQEFIANNQSDPVAGMADEIQGRPPQASPYPQKLTQKIQRMVKGGATPDQIAKFLNQAMP